MIVESCVPFFSSKKPSQLLKSAHLPMAMSKLTIKQNGHSSINENRTDDDYGGGGIEADNHSPIPS